MPPMGRRPNPQRKQDLLEEIVVYLGEHGIGDLSLRPLAKWLGTSTYTLTYQFGSKDQLIGDAVRHGLELRRRHVDELTGDGAPARPADLVELLWRWSTHPPNLRVVRMLLEATTLAASQPERFGDVGRQAVTGGVRLLADALRAAGLADAAAERAATQAHATLVGLQLDLMATGERERVEDGVGELRRSLDRAADGAGRDRPGPARLGAAR